jgi:hypothetical protein
VLGRIHPVYTFEKDSVRTLRRRIRRQQAAGIQRPLRRLISLRRESLNAQVNTALEVLDVPSLFYLLINPATADSAVEIVSVPSVATVVIAATVAPTAKAQAVPATAVGAGRAVQVVDGTLRARNRS